MVNKIMATQQADLKKRDHQGAMDGAKKKMRYGINFKDIFAKALVATVKTPVTPM